MRMKRVLKALVLVLALALFAPADIRAEQQQEQQQQGTTPAAAREGERQSQPSSATNEDKPAQEADQDEREKDARKTKVLSGAQQETAEPSSSSSVKEKSASQKAGGTSNDIAAQLQAGRREDASEAEAAIVPYYNNFLKDYRLGPEDVISIEVFNQPRYSKTGITVPPDGRISFYLIPEGVRVVGKTTQQVQEEIQKKLDEYIIDPQVTVYLDKAMSARYSVLGDVGRPGVMIMTRRVSVLEALAEAGGVLTTGDKKKVAILRRKTDGKLHLIPVNVSAIEKGKVQEMAYLAPGDQLIVPGNRLKSIQQLLSFVPMLSFGRIFGLPF